MANRENIKIEPMQVFYGEDVMQVQTIVTRADVASNLNNDYFFLYDSAGNKHYFWFDVNSAGADPAPSGGGTGHEVDIGVGATAAAVATALEAVIEAVTGFDSTVSGSTVTVTHTVAGYAQAAHEGVGTQFTFAVTTEGDSETDVGYTDGNIEFTSEEDLAEVKAHQRGTDLLSSIRTGSQTTVTVSLKETSVAQLKNAFRRPGGPGFTPGGAAGTEVFGQGSARQFTQTYSQAKRLRLHPVVLASTNLTRDVTFWKAYPKIDALAFSGEEILMLPLEFEVYPDTTKPAVIDKFCIGDYSQTFS